MLERHEHFNKHNHWVFTAYLDENLWTISSDYGTFSYRFHFSSGTLKEFLSSCSSDYLAGKLVHYDEKYVSNWDLTKIELKKEILRSRREREISEETANDLWFSLKYSESIDEYGFSEDPLDDWYEMIVKELSPTYKAVKEYVVEKLLEIYRKEV